MRIRLLGGISLDIEIPPVLWALDYARVRGRGEQGPKFEVDDQLNVAAGSSFDLRLEALATAGFRWIPRLSEQDREMLRVVDDGWEPPSVSTGGMSYQIFTFEARRPGDVEITFDYARPWEPQPIRTRTFRVHIA